MRIDIPTTVFMGITQPIRHLPNCNEDMLDTPEQNFKPMDRYTSEPPSGFNSPDKLPAISSETKNVTLSDDKRIVALDLNADQEPTIDVINMGKRINLMEEKHAKFGLMDEVDFCIVDDEGEF